jgi:hypothetical protein
VLCRHIDKHDSGAGSRGVVHQRHRKTVELADLWGREPECVSLLVLLRGSKGVPELGQLRAAIRPSAYRRGKGHTV